MIISNGVREMFQLVPQINVFFVKMFPRGRIYFYLQVALGILLQQQALGNGAI